MNRVAIYHNSPVMGPYELGKILAAIAGPDTHNKTMIDLCCNNANTTRHTPFKEATYVDVKADAVVNPLPNFYNLDVLSDNPIFDKMYDVSFAIDAIEHFLKDDGVTLLTRMLTLSKTAILFTPLGDHCVNLEATDPYEHKSGWLPSDPEIDGFDKIVFPKFHPTMNLGAFIFWKNTETEDFDRVIFELSRLNVGMPELL